MTKCKMRYDEFKYIILRCLIDSIDFLTAVTNTFQRYFVKNPFASKVYENIGYTIILLIALASWSLRQDLSQSIDIPSLIDTSLIETNSYNEYCTNHSNIIFYNYFFFDKHIISTYFIFFGWNLWYIIYSCNITQQELMQYAAHWPSKFETTNVLDANMFVQLIISHNQKKVYIFCLMFAGLSVYVLCDMLLSHAIHQHSVSGDTCDNWGDICFYTTNGTYLIYFFIVVVVRIVVLCLITFFWSIAQLHMMFHLWHWNKIDLYLESVHHDEYQDGIVNLKQYDNDDNGTDTDGNNDVVVVPTSIKEKNGLTVTKILDSEPHLVQFIHLKRNPPYFEKVVVYILDTFILQTTMNARQYLYNMSENKTNICNMYKYNIWDRFIWYPIFDLIIVFQVSSLIWSPICSIVSKVDFVVFKMVEIILDQIHQLYIPQWVRVPSDINSPFSRIATSTLPSAWTSQYRARSSSMFAKCLVSVMFSLIGLFVAAAVVAQFQWLTPKGTAFEFVKIVFINLVEVKSLINVQAFEGFVRWICGKMLAIFVLFEVNVIGKQLMATIASIYFADMNTFSANIFSYTGIQCIVTLTTRCTFGIMHFRCLSTVSDADLFTIFFETLWPFLMCGRDFYRTPRNTIWFVDNNCPFVFSNDVGTYIARSEGNKIYYQLKYYFKKWFSIDYFQIKMMRYVLFYHSPIDIDEYYICDIIIQYCLNNTHTNIYQSNGLRLCNSMAITSTPGDFIDNDSLVDYEIPFGPTRINIERALTVSNHAKNTIKKTQFMTSTDGNKPQDGDTKLKMYIATFELTLIDDHQINNKKKKMNFMKRQKSIQHNMGSHCSCRYFLRFN